MSDPFKERREAWYRNVQQSIENDEHFPHHDEIAQEDFMFYALEDLTQSRYLDEREALNIFSHWIKIHRPDTTVIHLSENVSKPFYE